ncbi:MAG: trehalose-phosphatase [Candidatus Colwellbacteria bacterium RIFCSPLOWO2_01_FULL_48_10]|uniref:Trehalose 6-phosphate phosphatase n=1 Tax=Candidatus Colwellbacteria bacterium RIFCSPLOWO2_01_FULL_48_10 TaxID=1797690 RepID=A0A1G1Z6K5_9BACT|nr:MAG: trehalose-phosphatase [Candidatus Colwellbacteria bacterium RIFCSPLOWO2_01_FULL_48_10]
MRYLNENLKKKITDQALGSGRVFLLLDYDGTLAPIVARPELAKLREPVRRLLNKLVNQRGISIGIITGRTIREMKSIIHLKKMIYAGNHGLELEGPDFSYTHAKAKRYRGILKKIAAELKPLSKSFPRTFLEDKGVTLTYHFRLLEARRAPDLKAEILKRESLRIKKGLIKVWEAKKALEIRPNFNWDKGSAARWVLLHQDPDCLPVYIGDDKTDESAFKALKGRGITVKVGFDRHSSAQYFVRSANEVGKFLSFFVRARGRKN